ncbi:MAG: hypothetical protein ABI186_01845, partial [Candidatus Elarobacter sp.]
MRARRDRGVQQLDRPQQLFGVGGFVEPLAREIQPRHAHAGPFQELQHAGGGLGRAFGQRTRPLQRVFEPNHLRAVVGVLARLGQGAVANLRPRVGAETRDLAVRELAEATFARGDDARLFLIEVTGAL